MKIKQKSKKAVTKRFKITGQKKLKRKSAYRSHLAHNKTTKQKRQARKSHLVSKADAKRYDQLMTK